MSKATSILENQGHLGKKLYSVQDYVLKRYKYYNDEVKNDTSIEIKTTNKHEIVNSDDIKKTINDIRNKLLIDHFVFSDNEISKLFNKNLMNKVIKSALISGCAFIRIFKNQDGTIELIPYDAYYATGKLNNNNTLDSAITIDDTDSKGNPSIITHYMDNKITTIHLNDEIDDINDKYATMPIVPIIIEQNALKPFGNSLITKNMMSKTEQLKKAKQRADIVSDTLTNANTFILGASKDLIKNANYKDMEALKNVVILTKDNDGQSPTITHTESGANTIEDKIKELESSIKYDTSTPEYLDMIESIRQDLIEGVNLVIKTIYQMQGRLNQFKEVDIVFKNNDFNGFSAFMDGVLKVNQVTPGYLSKLQLDKLLGINGNENKLLNTISKINEKSGE